MTTDIHSSGLNGSKNVKKFSFGSGGFCIIRLIVKSINGFVKSIAFSLSAVIVNDPIAMSAS